MATPIRIKRSAVAGKKPTEEQLQLGELAVNFYDGKVFFKQDTGGAGIATGIVEVGGNLEQLQVSIAATTASLTLSNIGVAVTAILDEDGFASDRDDALATQQSIKSYVDAQVTAQDIDFAGDTGTGSVDLDSETLTIAGTTNEIETVGSGNTLTVGLPNVVAITTSLTVGSATTITESGIVAGIVTGTLDNNLTLATSGTGLSGSATYNNSGVVTFTVTSDATDANTASTIVSRDGSGNFSAGTISADLTGVASTATKLETSRTFELTGDVVASQISFDGTGNVSLAATIQPNSVGLGTDTTGDYVKSITGTANQITVTSGTGEGSTPTLSIPIQLTAPQDVTVTRDLQVDRNINVTGNITIGGTSNALTTQTLQVADADLVLGVRTDGAGNDISNDTTANHGGISIASTEGNPLINLIGAGETLPATYKKIMWFKSGSFAGLGTDAWMINYGVGIGSTQFPEGTRLAVGSVQFTENDLSVVENINASGIVTALTFKGALTGDVTGTATTATNLANATGITTGTISDARLPDLITSNINASSGVSTFTELKVGTSGTAITMSAGIVTATTFDGDLTGDVTGTATTATNLANATGITTGTIDNARLPDLITSNINVSSGISTFTELKVGTAGTAITMSAGIVTATTFIGALTGDVTGTATTATNLANATGITTGTISDARLPDLITSNINASSGISTVNELKVGTAGTAITMSAGIVTATTFSGALSGTATTATNLTSGANITTGTISDARLPDLITSNINASSGISTVNELKVGTAGTVITMSAGIVTATEFVGGLTGTATTATNLANATGITTGTIDDARLPDLITSNINASSGVSTFNELKVGTAGTVITMSAGIVTATTFDGALSGTATTANNLANATGITTGTIDNARLPDLITSNINASSGISTVNELKVGTAGTVITMSAGIVTATTFIGALTGDVTGTASNATKAGIATYTAEWILESGDGSDYGISGPGLTGTENDPTFYVTRGEQYKFTNNTGGHPFQIQSTPNGSAGVAYTDGIDNNPAGDGTTLLWNVQFDSPSVLYYQCTTGGHGGMGGKIYIGNSGQSITVDGNVGVGTTNASGAVLASNTSIVHAGIVTANSYYGDGANLTNTGATLSATSGVQRLVVTNLISGTMTSAATTESLSYDATNIRLGIGTTTPTSKLHVVGDAKVTGIITALEFYGNGAGLTGVSAGTSFIENTDNQSQFIPFQVSAATTDISGISTQNFVFNPSTKRLGIGTGTPTSNLHVVGGANVTGVITATSFSGSGASLTTLNATNITTGTINDARLPDLITSNINASSGVSTISTLHVSNLTNNRVVIAGDNKQLEDDADLTFNGVTLNVGTGITLSSSTNDISITGSYFGDGSELTNVDNQFNSGMTDRLHYVPGPALDTALTFPSTSDKAYIIESIRVANVDTSVGVGTTVNIIVSLNDTYIAYNIPINNGGTLELIEQAIVAGPSDVIKMWNTNTGYVGIQTATNVYISYSTKDDPNSRYFSTKSAGISSDTTSVKTFTANATLESINIANRTDSGDYPVTVSIVTGSTTSHIVKDLVVPKYGAIELLDRQLVVLSGDIIKVSAGTTNTIDVIISGKEHA